MCTHPVCLRHWSGSLDSNSFQPKQNLYPFGRVCTAKPREAAWQTPRIVGRNSSHLMHSIRPEAERSETKVWRRCLSHFYATTLTGEMAALFTKHTRALFRLTRYRCITSTNIIVKRTGRRWRLRKTLHHSLTGDGKLVWAQRSVI